MNGNLMVPAGRPHTSSSEATFRNDAKPNLEVHQMKTLSLIAVAIFLGTASGAFANSDDPDSTPNGPFFYVDTYGVPPAVLHQVHQPRRPSSRSGNEAFAQHVVQPHAANHHAKK
jgi:hypothetical protein